MAFTGIADTFRGQEVIQTFFWKSLKWVVGAVAISYLLALIVYIPISFLLSFIALFGLFDIDSLEIGPLTFGFQLAFFVPSVVGNLMYFLYADKVCIWQSNYTQ